MKSHFDLLYYYCIDLANTQKKGSGKKGSTWKMTSQTV